MRHILFISNIVNTGNKLALVMNVYMNFMQGKNIACRKIGPKQITLVGKSAQENIVRRKIGPKQIVLV